LGCDLECGEKISLVAYTSDMVGEATPEAITRVPRWCSNASSATDMRKHNMQTSHVCIAPTAYFDAYRPSTFDH
jgi:hypothetical protein